jgi:hypothetical protein
MKKHSNDMRDAKREWQAYRDIKAALDRIRQKEAEIAAAKKRINDLSGPGRLPTTVRGSSDSRRT